ncbi:hypothetical protein JCM18897A_36890 [Streptomyces sp. JCM 18897]|nr:hypothetical protein MTP02_23440 [Streptomyces albus]
MVFRARAVTEKSASPAIPAASARARSVRRTCSGVGAGCGMGGPRSGAAWAGAGGRSRRTVTPAPTVRTGPPRVRVA